MAEKLAAKYIAKINEVIMNHKGGKGMLNEKMAWLGVMQSQERARVGNDAPSENIPSGNGTGGYDNDWEQYADGD